MPSSTQKPVIEAYNQELLHEVAQTVLMERPIGGSSTTLVVENQTGFGDGDYVLIEEFGTGVSEIRRISGSPAGNVLTLSAFVSFTHEKGVKVYRIDRNEVEFSRAATEDGSKVVLATVAIQADRLSTVYEDTANTTGYGFYRWKNSADNTFTDYSEPFLYAGYTSQSLKTIFEDVLRKLGQTDNAGNPIYQGKISRDAMFSAIVEGQDEISGMRTRWSYLSQFQTVIAEFVCGEDTYFLGDNVTVDVGQGSTLNLRMQGEKQMKYFDKGDFDDRYRQNVARSTLAAPLATSDVTATLADSSDFDDAGSFRVVNDDGKGMDTVVFGDNDRGTNVLSDVEDVDENHSSGAVVWQGGSFGKSCRFTVYDGNVVLDPIPDERMVGRSLIGDLYVKPTLVNDLADRVQFPAYVMRAWLFWQMSLLKYNGDVSKSKESYDLWTAALSRLLREEDSGQMSKVKPTRNPNAYYRNGRLNRTQRRTH